MTLARLAAGVAGLALAFSAQAAHEVYNFNPAWRLHVGDAPGPEAPAFDDAAWRPVTLPRARSEDAAFAKGTVDRRTGIAWYRKRFTLPADVANRKVFVEFEGARLAAEGWVNGQRVGLHENGVTAFGFDLSQVVKPGDNVIAVRTDNRWDYREQATNQRYQWADRDLSANHVGRPEALRLHMTDKSYQTLPPKAHRRQVVGIGLTGGFKGGVETANTQVANQKIVSTGAAPLGRSALTITEAEFYKLP